MWIRRRESLVILFALVMVMTACTSETTTTTAGPDGEPTTTGETEPTGTTAAEGGTEGDRLVFGVTSPDVETNNTNRGNAPDEYQLKPMYENLIGSDPNTGAWIPMLAESWELDENGSSLRFHLRQGVQFHGDWGEFTAEDVLFTYEDLINPPGALSDGAEIIRNAVESVEVADTYEVVFHLHEYNFEFLEAVGYGTSGMAIKSKADGESRENYTEPPIEEAPLAGTGPYQFLERSPGVNVVFEAVPYDHWRINPEFQQLEMRFINEDSARLSALLAGEIHITELGSDLMAEAESQGMALVESATPGRRMGMNFLGAYLTDPAACPDDATDHGREPENLMYADSPMNDLEVRRAINKAIDRDALNAAFFGGTAEPTAMWYWQPDLAGWNPEWEDAFDEWLGYDPDAARQILADAGYAEGEISIQMLATPDYAGPESADVVEAVAGMLNDVGIQTEILSLDPAQHRASREGGVFDFTAAMEFDDTRSEHITGFRPQGYGNNGAARGRAVESCLVDQIYEETLITLDQDAQAELYRELGDVVFDLVQHVALFRQPSYMVVNPDVVGSYTFPGAVIGVQYSHYEYVTKP